MKKVLIDCVRGRIYGDKDPKGYILAQIPNAKQRKIAATGHFMMIEQPKEFYSVLARFAIISLCLS